MDCDWLHRLLEVADLNSYNSDNKKLTKREWKEIKKDVEKIKEYTTNPSKKGVNKDALFNLKKRKQASNSTESFLLSVMSEGEEKRNSFVTDCQKDSARFGRPIINNELWYRKLSKKEQVKESS